VSGQGRVVVGVSDSLPGLQALRFAVAEARRRGMPLHAVRVWPMPPAIRTGPAYPWHEDLTAETRRYVNAVFDDALGGLPDGMRITVAGPSGRADVALTETVSDVDILVLGAPASRWHHSGVVRACTRAARCPVIVVPPPELARTVRRTSLRRLVREVIEQT
jgi:nucleotide-binding universal stress UspA family protein